MAAHQAPPSLGFSRQEYWSGLPFLSPMQACMLSRFSHVRLCASTRLTGFKSHLLSNSVMALSSHLIRLCFTFLTLEIEAFIWNLRVCYEMTLVNMHAVLKILPMNNELFFNIFGLFIKKERIMHYVITLNYFIAAKWMILALTILRDFYPAF